jgi:hypothetical protein
MKRLSWWRVMALALSAALMWWDHLLWLWLVVMIITRIVARLTFERPGSTK